MFRRSQPDIVSPRGQYRFTTPVGYSSSGNSIRSLSLRTVIPSGIARLRDQPSWSKVCKTGASRSNFAIASNSRNSTRTELMMRPVQRRDLEIVCEVGCMKRSSVRESVSAFYKNKRKATTLFLDGPPDLNVSAAGLWVESFPVTLQHQGKITPG